MIQPWDWEVKELRAKAEQADRRPLEDGWTLPEEIEWRQERKATWAAGRAQIEARAQAGAAAERAECKAKLEERAAQKDPGKKPRGPEPKEPSQPPTPGDPYNGTDPDGRRQSQG